MNELPSLNGPERPDAQALADDPLLRYEYLEDRKTFQIDTKVLDREYKQLYSKIWGQCAPELRGKLKGENGCTAMAENKKTLELLICIKQNCCGFEAHKMKYYALMQAMKKLIYFYQKPSVSNEQYKEEFEALWDAVGKFGGSMSNHPTLINAVTNDIAKRNLHVDVNGAAQPVQNDIDQATLAVENRMKACLMLGGAHNERFGELKSHLENQYIMGVDQYPDTTEGLLGMMNNFRVSSMGSGPRRGQQLYQVDASGDDGLAFAQEGNEEAEGAGAEEGVNAAQQRAKSLTPKPKANIYAPDYKFKDKTCYHCGQKTIKQGHIA